MQTSDRYAAQNATLSVGTTSEQLLPENLARKVLYVRNSGTAGEIITLSLGTPAAVSLSGLVLANGQNFVQSADSVTECWQGPIQIISDTAATAVSLLEY